MQRITLAYLQAVINRINSATGSPAQPYVMGADGRHRAQPRRPHARILGWLGRAALTPCAPCCFWSPSR